MSKVYVWNFYYPTAASVQAKLREAQRIVADVAGKNWRLVSAGEQLLTICFVSDLTHQQLRERITAIGEEKLCHFVFEASAFVASYGSPDVQTWLMSRLPYERKSSR